MPRAKRKPVEAPVLVALAPKEPPRKRCGDRLLPDKPAFANTVILKSAPPEWNFRQAGAKAWA